MQYIHRTLERRFLRMNDVFKAVMVVGARQVGKSTMLKHLAANEKRKFVTLLLSVQLVLSFRIFVKQVEAGFPVDVD